MEGVNVWADKGAEEFFSNDYLPLSAYIIVKKKRRKKKNRHGKQIIVY